MIYIPCFYYNIFIGDNMSCHIPTFQLLCSDSGGDTSN